MIWIRSPAGRAIISVVAIYAVMTAIVVGLRISGYSVSLGVRLGIAVAVGIPAVAFVLKYWNAIDEAAREAQKWAWFWGGSCGMAVGLVALSVKPLGLASMFEGATPTHLMAYGGITVIFTQLLGFFVAWAFWWGSRR